MTDITWGPEIAVNGVRPAWLSDNRTPIRWYGEGMTDAWWDRVVSGADLHLLQWGEGLTSIRLHADHFAYIALDKGFEPWGGGDAAPDDWDGDAYGVLYRDGMTLGRKAMRWEKCDMDNDIIGYRKRTETPGDTVTVPRLSLTDVSEAREAYIASASKASHDSALFYARRWGLLREEPVDPLLLKARDIAARHMRDRWRPGFADGSKDGSPIVQAVLEALRG